MPTHPVRSPEWIATAPIQVTVHADVAAPPETVWAHIADHERWPEWFTVLDRVERIGSGEGVGSGRRVTIGRITFDEEFTAWEPGAHFAFAVVRTPVPLLGALAESVRIDATEAGCRVTYRQGLQARWRAAQPLLRLLWRRAPAQLRRALEGLRVRAEG